MFTVFLIGNHVFRPAFGTNGISVKARPWIVLVQKTLLTFFQFNNAFFIKFGPRGALEVLRFNSTA